MKNPLKQLFGQTAVYGMGIVLPRLLNYLLLTPFYTRVFEKATYGIITELYAYVVFLLVVLTYGMETGFFRFASHSDKKERVYTSIISALFISSSLFILAIMFWSDPISRVMDYADHPEYIRWLAVIVGIDAFTSVPFARIRLYNRPLRYALIRIVEVSINIGLNIFFLYYCPRHQGSAVVDSLYRPEIGVGYVLISNMIASFVKLVILLPEILKAFRSKIDMKLLASIFKYSYPLLIAGLAGTVNEALDRVLLKHLVSPELNPMEQLGIYGANYKLAVLMTLFVQMFKYAAEPFFFARSKDKDAKKLYADVMTFFVIAGLFIFLLVNFYLDYFVLFIGSDFREGVKIVPIVLMANLVMGIFFNLSIWYKLSNKTIYGAILVIIGALITVAINVSFIPKYAYVASAWAHLICYSVMVLLSFLWSRKTYAVPYKIGRILGYMALAVALFAFNELFLSFNRFQEIWGLVLITIFMATAVYREYPTFRKYKNAEINGS